MPRKFATLVATLLLVASTANYLSAVEVDSSERDARAAAYLSITSGDMKRHVGALADDTFEGREAGTRGGRAAGVYIVKELQRLGVEPAGVNGSYYQSFGPGYRNILAQIEGSDPELRDEVILVGAHYDHVGYGNAQNSYGPIGYIHNGADDNASGTSTLLELAEALTKLNTPPRRTIAFAWWDGEEKGLLGSIDWAQNPTISLDRIKLVVNMDMVGRMKGDKLFVYGTRSCPGLRQLVSRQNDDTQLELDFSWEMDENSDHFTFYSRSIPILMPFSGLHDDYHRPSDDVERINADGMQSIGRLLFNSVLEIANRDQSPQFRSASRREGPAAQKRFEQPLPPLPGRFGVYWDSEQDASNGLRLTRVATGGPAEQAGLRGGDVIIEFDGRRVTDADELSRWVLASTANVTVVVRRPGAAEPLELPVELGGSPVRLGIAWRADDADPACVLISRVVSGSPAEEAGVMEGDRVYEISGHTFSSPDEFKELVTGLGSPLELLLERDGRLRTARIEIPEISGMARLLRRGARLQTTVVP